MTDDVPENLASAVALLRRHHYHTVADWAESRRIDDDGASDAVATDGGRE